MEKKYCCDWFKFHYCGDKNFGLNIRIVKLSPDAIKFGILLKCDKIFYVTEGYIEYIADCEKKIVINFCPFCEKELKKIYGKNDDYVQEISD